MTDGLKPEQRETIITTLSANRKVERMVLFGSRAMGTFTPTSDIDIALFGDELTLSDQAALAEEVASLSIAQRVDILIYHRIENQALREHIRKHGVEWFARRRGASMASTTRGEWRDTVVGEFAPFLYGKGLPEVRRRPGSIPVYGSNGIVGFHSEPLLSGPAVIIGRKGSVGAVHYCPEPSWPIDTTFYVVDDDPARLRFKYYLLKSLGLERMNTDSAVPGLNRDAAHARIIKVPPLPEQRAIAHILGTLDDKIEFNRKQNATLEAMARALFKAWFVDFEPVRAKMAGRWQRGQSLPGLPAHLYDLFPDRLVESELGEIPEGWRVQLVGDLAEVSSGQRPKVRHNKPSPEASVPLWGSNGPMAFVPEPLTNEPILLTGRVGTLGSVFRTSTPCWPSDNTLVVRANHPFLFEYIYFQLRQIDYTSLNRGSTQPLLTQTDLKSQRLILPNNDVLERFSRFASNVYRRIDANENESRTLAALRDTLLPKLVSGEIRVKDAERFLKERGL